MQFIALACDYDGTLASHGRVADATLRALERLKASGRRLLLVTGREFEDLLSVFPGVGIFDWVVAENGAHLIRPDKREEKLLGEPPPEAFLRQLRREKVEPLAVGRVIVATRDPHRATVSRAIHDLGLELQMIFNRGAVMILPSGVNKATGLAAALQAMALSPHNAVGIGDAENDHSFLALCECGVAVGDALPMLKESADLVMPSANGAGVVELVNHLLDDELRRFAPRLNRRQLLLGRRCPDGSGVLLPSSGHNVLIMGPSGSGKSTAATAILERLAEAEYQFCIIDPEGDYEGFEAAVSLGGSNHGLQNTDVLQVLKDPNTNVVANLLGVPLADRPAFFLALLPHMLEMRARTGRPHWLIVDEAHHLLPPPWQPTAQVVPQELSQLLLITVHPAEVSPAILALMDIVIVVGPAPEKAIAEFCAAIGLDAPAIDSSAYESGKVLLWFRAQKTPPYRVEIAPGRTERQRHNRKYAEGELPPDMSFYFRGPDAKLNLRAQNLILFTQLADGVDDATWLFHLHRGHYSHWFRETIKNTDLADETALIERMKSLSAAESRARVRAAVERNYTLPATTRGAKKSS